MWRATTRGLLARRLRLGLTALAVVLGVAFVSGTFVLTDTLRHAFDGLFAETVSDVDLVVWTRSPFEGAARQRERLPESLLDTIRAVPGVEAVEGVVQGDAQFVAPDGEAIQHGGAPTFGISWGDVSPLRIVDGRRPERDGEVAMDAGTAAGRGFAVGQRVRVLLQGPAEELTLVGTFSLGDRVDLGPVTFAAFDLETAQRVFAAEGVLDLVNVRAEPGADPVVLGDLVASALPGDYEVLPAREAADERARPVREGLAFLEGALLGFAGVGLFVGAFIIFNTFSILVSQRTRELGLLRALGASRPQVVGSVLAEAAALGAVASAVGLAAGIGLARLLLRLLDRLDFAVPGGPALVLGRTVVASLAVGLLVTVTAALLPARRASRIPPVAAIHDVTLAAGAPLGRRGVTGGAVLLAGTVLLAAGLARDRGVVGTLQVVGAGALVMFVGLATLAPVLARPFTRLLAPLLDRTLGVTGTLARGNAGRNPRRTAATASATVVGLGLVSLVAIFAASAKASVRDAIGSGLRADLVVRAEQLADFSAGVGQRIRSLPEVEAVAGLRLGDAEVDGRTVAVFGTDPATVEEVVDLGIVEGDVAGLAGGGILVEESEARRLGVGAGDSLPVGFLRGGRVEVPVAGVHADAFFTGGLPVRFLLSAAHFDALVGGTGQEFLVLVKASAGRADEVREAAEAALADFPNVEVFSRDEYRRQAERSIDVFLAVMLALLLLAVVIAVLGIVNTLVLSVVERTRELGLLRVVGMSRRQTRAMVRAEAVVVALMGGVLGVAIGLLWAWAMTEALRDQGISVMDVPVLQLLGFVALSAVSGVAAAVFPARRAARLDVLEAIAEE